MFPMSRRVTPGLANLITRARTRGVSFSAAWHHAAPHIHSTNPAPLNFDEPLLDVVKAAAVGDVVHLAHTTLALGPTPTFSHTRTQRAPRVHARTYDNDAVRAAVVAACDGAKALLAGRVPLRAAHLHHRFKTVRVVRARCSRASRANRTICSFALWPSRSTVRIFCE